MGRAAILTRLLRASMLEIIRLEYVTTARAKGLAEKTIILKHALKNALIPTVTIMGLQVGFLIGVPLSSRRSALPGLGTYGINAIIARDYQQVQGFILLVAICFVVINFVVDLTYAFFDPRIRYGAYPVRQGGSMAHSRQQTLDSASQPRRWSSQPGNVSSLLRSMPRPCTGYAVRQPCLAWACCWCSSWWPSLPMSWLPTALF